MKGNDTEKTCRKCHKFPETTEACSIWFSKASTKTIPLIYRHDDALRWLPRVFASNPRYRVPEGKLVSLQFCSRDSLLWLPL